MEVRGLHGARVETRRQELPLFIPKKEEGTSVQLGTSVGAPAPLALAPLSLALLAEPLPAFSAPTPLPSAKGRAISLPMDLDAHISSLLSSGASCVAATQRNASNYKTATRAFPRVMPTANQWDYKNIIEKLQVGGGLCSGCVLSGLSMPRPPEGAG